MSDRVIDQFRRAGSAERQVDGSWLDRWYGRVAMLLGSIVLLTLAYAPYGQFYLAWVGLVPWLLMIRRTRSAWSAFWWSWAGGTAFFIANMWWLAYVTVPGMFALLAYLGLWWGVSAAIMRSLMENGKWKMENVGTRASPFSIFHFPFSIVAIATIWSGCEWFRGNYPFDGLPWLYLGHTQTPVLVMCQVADVLGATGVTFWVAMVNVLVAMVWVSRWRLKSLAPAIVMVTLVLVGVGAYGAFRMKQQTLSDGPSVLVVQANFPQSNETGRKGASIQEIVRFHVETTRAALEKLRNEPTVASAERRATSDESHSHASLIAEHSALPHPVDLVVWSETMMPDINPRARQLWQGQSAGDHADYGKFLDQTLDQIQTLALSNKVAMIVGGSYFDARKDRQTNQVVMDNRNSAYFFGRTGMPFGRYDKIHLVPWGEFIPFKHSIPWLYRIFLELSPYDYDYTLTPGSLDDLTVFELSDDDSPAAWRFVVPICFEDIDADLVARMLRPLEAGGNKRADFIVNITNDGWFKANEQPQHLQVAVFRSIENRVATARSVNTGISGFIDPLGRVDESKLIAKGQPGWSVATLTLDSRTAPFTRWGEWFAALCASVTAMIGLFALVRRLMRKRPSTT